MSGQVHQRPARYLGIINGIVFRIDSTVDTSGRTVGLVALEMEPAVSSKGFAVTQALPPPAARAELPLTADASSARDETPGIWTDAQQTVDEAQSGTMDSAILPFARDGAEPLRAGHPDLWNLLVAGTCLEGSSFRSG